MGSVLGKSFSRILKIQIRTWIKITIIITRLLAISIDINHIMITTLWINNGYKMYEQIIDINRNLSATVKPNVLLL